MLIQDHGLNDMTNLLRKNPFTQVTRPYCMIVGSKFLKVSCQPIGWDLMRLTQYMTTIMLRSKPLMQIILPLL
jgi:hypothetical protein